MKIPLKDYWDLLAKHVSPQKLQVCYPDRFFTDQHWLAGI